MSIDSSSRIDPSAKVAASSRIGPWCIVGPGVTIGENCKLESHVVVRSNTIIGDNNHIFQFCSVGEDPSDKKFKNEEVWLEIGDNNTFREGVTLHRGTAVGGGVTQIGSDNLFMPYVHIAHDCQVGSHTVFANNASLSGHVTVDDWAILGGYAGVNQFVKIGAHSMIGGVTHVAHDIPAYVIVSGQPAAVRAINSIGLERRGFKKDIISVLRKAYKLIYLRGLSLTEALAQLELLKKDCEAVELLIESLKSSKKGIHR
ncbi:MAG: acyl-[acyl-carrier-protein]--UDP-N-acetylglucosamine O-acyltransferase [Gammaproteobacteria bacterium]|nr:acyl-[acyl-carrier-protein]--UDP-N-acetylglucosamine O-acyltransferase [Gammaproteobacteria bacterium]